MPAVVSPAPTNLSLRIVAAIPMMQVIRPVTEPRTVAIRSLILLAEGDSGIPELVRLDLLC